MELKLNAELGELSRNKNHHEGVKRYGSKPVAVHNVKIVQVPAVNYDAAGGIEARSGADSVSYRS